MKLDIDKLSAAELEKLTLKIEKRKEDLAQEKLQKALKDVEAAAKKHGMTLSDVLKAYSGKGPAKKKRKSTAKYKNPGDASKTWSGMGRKPQWVIAHLEAGKALEDLAI